MKTSIFVLEDDPVFQKLVAGTLKAAFGDSVTVQVVGELKNIRQLLLEHPCDLIILDLNLPDSVGIDTLNAVKQMSPSIPVIVLTGESGEGTHLRAVQEGALQLIGKNPESMAAVPPAVIAAITAKAAHDKSFSHLDKRLDAIHSSLREESNRVEGIGRDCAIIKKCVFGNGEKKDSLKYKVDVNTRIVNYIQKTFWIAIGALAASLATAIVSWFWASL